MSRGACTPEQVAACPLPRHFSDQHHLYWPRRDFSTQLEKQFRDLPQNKEQRCRWEHDQAHAEEPPLKPSREEMLLAITEIALGEAS